MNFLSVIFWAAWATFGVLKYLGITLVTLSWWWWLAAPLIYFGALFIVTFTIALIGLALVSRGTGWRFK